MSFPHRFYSTFLPYQDDVLGIDLHKNLGLYFSSCPLASLGTCCFLSTVILFSPPINITIRETFPFLSLFISMKFHLCMWQDMLVVVELSHFCSVLCYMYPCSCPWHHSVSDSPDQWSSERWKLGDELSYFDFRKIWRKTLWWWWSKAKYLILLELRKRPRGSCLMHFDRNWSKLLSFCIYLCSVTVHFFSRTPRRAADHCINRRESQT